MNTIKLLRPDGSPFFISKKDLESMNWTTALEAGISRETLHKKRNALFEKIEQMRTPSTPQTFESIYNLKQDRNFLIKNFLLPGTCTMIFGVSGCTKSLIVDTALLCISLGLPFLEMPTKKHGVLLIDNENNQQLLRDRFRALLAGLPAKRKPKNFWIASRIGSLDSGDTIENTLDFCKKNKISLVCMDTLRRCTMAEENSSSEINEFFQNAVQPFLKEKIAVIFIHHAQKQNGKYRGSGDIMGFTDSSFSVEFYEQKVTIHCEKSRTTEPTMIKAQWVFGTDAFFLNRLKESEKENGTKDSQVREKICQMFTTPGQILHRYQIADNFDEQKEKGEIEQGWITKSILDKALRRLVKYKKLAIPKKGQYKRVWDDVEGLLQGRMTEYDQKNEE